MVLIYPFSLLHHCKPANCPFLGRTVLYSQILSLVLKCPFLYKMMVIADSSYFFIMSLLGKIKNCQPHVWPPSTFGNCSWLAKSKGRGRRSRHHTQPQDSDINVTEMHVTQRSRHLHAAHSNHPSASEHPPDHMMPEIGVGGVSWLENSWDHSESSS